MSYAAVAMGCSAGGFAALEAILGALPANFSAPILLVQHLHPSDTGLFAEHLGQVSRLPVHESTDKASIVAGHVHVAPAGYHLLVEDSVTLALSIDPPVNFSRPAIDVLFESAARIWSSALVGVLLSGASNDGTAGLRTIRAAGGRCLVQDPDSAEASLMPQSAIAAGVANEILSPSQIASRLQVLFAGGSR